MYSIVETNLGSLTISLVSFPDSFSAATKLVPLSEMISLGKPRVCISHLVEGTQKEITASSPKAIS